MSQLPAKQPAGFTIIETLIVLAIAGLILLVVLMAAPAVIRSGHNNQRKQDVTSILNAISRYQLNNTGSFPQDDPGHTYLQYAKLSFYEKADVHLNNRSASNGNIDTSGMGDTIQVYYFALCNTDGKGATGTGAGYRDIVAIYKIETGGNLATKCQQQ